VVLAVNKSEGHAVHPGFYDAYALGLGEPLAISAEHGLGIGDLADAIAQARAEIEPVQGEFEPAARDFGSAAEDVGDIESGGEQLQNGESRPLRIAVVGRPNVGKSTLVNALLGEERMITGPEAGITRDAISIDLQWDDRALRLFDTAGLRRKMRVEGRAEELSVGDALKAIRFAEVVVLLLDAERPFEKQDLQIAELISEEGRALVIAVNKWDLVRERDKRLKELREICQRLLPQIKGVALVPVSALDGKGLAKLMQAVFAADQLWNRRIPTHALNQWLMAAVEAHPPPAVSGRRIKLRYITQANARPPTFALFCSRPKALPDSYPRYLVNSLRDTFDMPGVPIRLNLRKGANPYAKGSG
ncbi:MAG: ribosome biogenesis GTPase Der, partial [Methyloceanibacter sp.]